MSNGSWKIGAGLAAVVAVVVIGGVVYQDSQLQDAADARFLRHSRCGEIVSAGGPTGEVEKLEVRRCRDEGWQPS